MGGRKVKSRTQVAYQRKLRKIQIWHEKRLEARKLWSKERLNKTTPLKSLEFYTDLIRKSGDK